MHFAFAGTPDFAAWVLRDLEALGRRPSLVISQPDRARGRGQKKGVPPAVVEAERQGIPHLQTEDINQPEVIEHMQQSGASALLVAGFGQILSPAFLESILCLNVHASLLPKYRGAAPIERALAAGEEQTGITVMRVTEHLDQGPWALQTSVSIGLREDAGGLGRVLAMLGAAGVVQVLDGLVDGTVRWREQEGVPSYAEKLGPRDYAFDTTRGARAAHDQVRSLSPTIGARTASGTVAFKVWRTWPYGQPGLDEVPAQAAVAAGRPGRLVTEGGRLFVGCSQGVLEMLVVQPVGRNRMRAAAFLRGYRRRLGETLEPGPHLAKGPGSGRSGGCSG